MSDVQRKLLRKLNLPESAEDIFKRLKKEEEEQRTSNSAMIELEAKLKTQRMTSN